MTESNTITPRCHIPWQQMIVDSTGAAAPCCYWGAYENLNSPVGNVKEQSIEEIWNGPAYQKLRAGMASGDLAAAGCAKCHAVRQGMGLGFDYDSDADGDTETPHGRNIAVLKDEIARGATVLEAKPTIISYTPSHRCNIRCTHCYQEETRDAEIKRADAADEIERLAPYLVRLIAGGGEPFLLPIWRRFLANFDTRKNPYLDFGTSTNATIVTEPVLAGLRRFKNMTINVSLDGTGETYERVRVGAKFDEVRANIRRLKEVVKAAPSPKANIGISMCVMKSNILDLPNLVRFARDEVLQFGMSPVITRPPDESLRCFNDPVKDMAGWADAIDAAKAELDSYFPSLAVVWRSQSVPDETQETWRNLFEVLRAQIPLDLADVPHKRVTLDIPDELMMRAAAAHGVAPLVAYIFPQRTTDGVSYWGPIKDGRCEVSLPDGAFSVGVSTKWAATGGNGGFFDVGDHQPDDAPIPVQAPTHRYSPRRVAAGVMRRARRMLDRVTEG
ncbi:radical SAM protein with 4Fe4S-binding SPASM domain [Bradyrhizobium sp. i1.8.4]